VRRTDNGLIWFHFSRADTAQEPPQEIGSSDYALLCSPYQDQVVVDDIVFGMFRLNLHASQEMNDKSQRVAGIFIAPLIMLAGLWLCLEVLGAWQAEWPFLDWTFRRCCWRLVVCLGLVLSRRSHPIFDPAHALDAPTKFVVTTREVQLEALSSGEAPMMASRR
jgi:hypothetical protein